jgi:hypothetical protein
MRHPLLALARQRFEPQRSLVVTEVDPERGVITLGEPRRLGPPR